MTEKKYLETHEWYSVNDNEITVGISDFAQSELGDIVYLEIDTLDAEINSNEVFGTVEAVKTVSDLFLPVSGEIIEFNSSLEETPEDVNSHPYSKGWMIKLKVMSLKLNQKNKLNHLRKEKELLNHISMSAKPMLLIKQSGKQQMSFVRIIESNLK